MQCQRAVLLISLNFLNVIASIHSEPIIPHGTQQFYSLVNKVHMTDVKYSSADETSYTFKSQLTINSVWHSNDAQLLQVYLIEPTVSAPAKGTNKLIEQDITKIPDRPFYISLIKGKPNKVIAHTSRDQSLLNLERGIASLLQVERKDGPVTEVDVSGKCNAFYAVKSTTRITKTKTDCSHWDLRVNYRAEKPLGVSRQSSELIDFHLSTAGTLLKAESQESHSFHLEAKPEAGSRVESIFILKQTGVGKEAVEQMQFESLELAIKSLLEWYRVFDIEADVDGALSELKHKELKNLIAAHISELSDENIGKDTLAQTMAKLLPVARITKQAEFVQILNKHKDLHAQLVDLLGAVQTIESHNAINEVFRYEEQKHSDFLEKYLQSLAVGTHPERNIIEEIWHRLRNKETPIENEKLRDTVIQTLAALARQANLDTNDALLAEVRVYFLEQLNTHCEDVVCKTLYLRALQNLQDRSTIPMLTDYAIEGDAKTSVAAMQALQSFSIVNFGEQQRQIFAQIFYQKKRKYDSSARLLALDIILAMKPTKEQLGHLLEYLASNDRQFEVKTYVLQKLRMLAEKCPRFASLLKSCLAERPVINNYHIIAQKGLTTVLTRQLSQTPSFNESLLSVQEIYKGVLKRGSVDLLLSAGREDFSSFKLGIYTSGLTSFVSDNDDNTSIEDDDDEDDSPSTAGMEISVQGVLLRPLIFFTGQSELMGHVWSGTASEPTTAYQATMLTHDFEHYVILASGATVYVRVLGARSVDLNGKVELSIWNRNANTEIKQNAGTAIVGYMVAGFTYAQLENEFTLMHEPSLSLQANLDFYSGVKLCMQLQRPLEILSHKHTKSVILKAAKKYSKSVTTKRAHKSPGKTLALNQKNNEMCNMIIE